MKTSTNTENYNGKTRLMICYQWYILDGGNDVEILNKEFNTFNEAFAEMERVLPNDYIGDDGYDIENWNALIDDKDPDIFSQYVADIDRAHLLLAVLSPVLD